MKKPFIFIIILSFSIALVSIIGSLLSYDQTEGNNDNDEKIKITTDITYEKVDKESPNIKVYDTDNNKVIKMNIEEYLYGVVSSEMPSTFNEEALKSQAIAARTYVIYKIENNITTGHENADICTNPAHCQAYTSYKNLKKLKGTDWIKSDYVKVKSVVDSTKGQILTYDNEPVMPLYFSTSSGKTENSEDVFSTAYPYLVSVDSPYEDKSPKYITTYSISKNKFIKYIKSNYPKLNISSSDLDKNINIKSRTDGGSVETIQIGNIETSGATIRKIFSLNSANFDIDYYDNNIEFTVKGYGHGVGMSQWGAEGMAQKGYKYYDILFHYFKNTDIKDIY